MILLLLFLAQTPVATPTPTPQDPFVGEAIKFIVTLAASGIIAFVSWIAGARGYAEKRVEAHGKIHEDHEEKHTQSERELNAKLEDLRRTVELNQSEMLARIALIREMLITVQGQIAPFGRIVEQAVLARLGSLPLPNNPITDEQRRGMASYISQKDQAPIADVYLARDGFEVEMSENTGLDQNTFLLYSLAWFAANFRIAQYESRERVGASS